MVSGYPRTAKKLAVLAWGYPEKYNLQKTQQDNKKYMFMRLLADVGSLKIWKVNFLFFISKDVYFQQLDDTANTIDKLTTPQLYGI